MILLKNLHKYFNYRRRNENHVLNDVSLALPETGLVMILGASGSGKTTLLNAAGGLDDVHSGTIEFQNQTFRNYDAKAWDSLRNRQIGYVFQNYLLISDKTVFENIELPLRMIGMTDAAAIERRINEVLSALEMKRFIHRLPGELSGGQQQRIAIARAIAKDPNLIIADEPTGNLDQKTSVDIMRLLKAISKTRLVLMVTHDIKLSSHFADRVVTIEDGKIVSDVENRHLNSVDLADGSDLFLDDFLAARTIREGNVHLEIHQTENLTPVSLRLFLKNNALFIESLPKSVHVTVMTPETGIEIHESHREAQAEWGREIDVPFAPIDPSILHRRRTFGYGLSVRMAFQAIVRSKLRTKLMYLLFVATALMIAIAVTVVGNLGNVSSITAEKYPENALGVAPESFTDYADFQAFVAAPSVKTYSFLTQESTISLFLPYLEQFQNQFQTKAFGLDKDIVLSSDLLFGELDPDSGSVYISEGLADQLLATPTFQMADILTFDDLLLCRISGDLLAADGSRSRLEIAAIVKESTPILYADADLIPFLMTPQNVPGPMDRYPSEMIQLDAGRLPVAANEILLPTSSYLESPESFAEYDWLPDSEAYLVVGLYHLETDEMTYSSSRPLMTNAGFGQFSFVHSGTRIMLLPNTLSLLRYTLDQQAMDYVFLAQEHAQSGIQVQQAATTGLSGALIFAFLLIALGDYFVFRSSMLGRIREIGIYRSLGVSKRDLLGLFWNEVFLLTTMSSFLGFVFAIALLFQAEGAVDPLVDLIDVTPFRVAIGVLAIYGLHALFGLLPIRRLLKLTPAAIMKKYDM